MTHLVQGLGIGGLEIMVVNFLERLDRQRFEPSVCCFDKLGLLAPKAQGLGIDVDLVARKPGRDIGYSLRLARHLRHVGTDVLHLHNPTAFFYGTLAGRLARVPCIIYTEHGRDFSSSRLIRIANGVLARLVTQVVAVAEFGKRYLVEKERVKPEAIVTIHNGIDGQQYAAHLSGEAVRQSLGLKQTQPVIGIVARLYPIKNHSVLLRAMPKVLEHFPDAALLLVGDGPLRAELHRQARDLGIAGRTHFLGARDDVPELLAAMDVFVLSSYSEGLSLTLVEACAAGKPVVATNVGGNSEVIRHGENGLLVENDNEAELARAILDLLSDRARMTQMGQLGRRLYEAEFNIDRMVARYEELYQTCFPG